MRVLGAKECLFLPSYSMAFGMSANGCGEMDVALCVLEMGLSR